MTREELDYMVLDGYENKCVEKLADVFLKVGAITSKLEFKNDVCREYDLRIRKGIFVKKNDDWN